MEDNYSIDEILSAVNDLQNINKDKNKKISKEIIKKLKFIKKNDFVVITAGLPFGKAGMTNMVRLYKVGS